MDAAGIREGIAEVPGARLRYRLAGTAGMPLLVFENGWGASCEMWAWMEQELAPHARLLFYNRAGIGGSEALQPQTVSGLSTQFAALVGTLGLEGPLTLVGQSYGGLVSGLHVMQRDQYPGLLRAVVEVDPTPDVADPEIDTPLRKLPGVMRLIQRWLRLGLPDLMFSKLVRTLPDQAADTLLRVALANPASLDGALAELALLHDIRARIAAGQRGGVPRLLIGAGTMRDTRGGLLERLLVNDERLRTSFERSKALQRQRPEQDRDCRLLMLPYSHGGLVFEQAGARATAAAVLDFLRALPR